MRRLVIASVLSAVAGAALATGVMLWEPWGNDLNPAKCEAALSAWKEAKDMYQNAQDKETVSDLLASAGGQFTHECHLDPPKSN